MNAMQYTIESLHLENWIYPRQRRQSSQNSAKARKIDLLAPLRQWLDNIEVKNSAIAHLICKSIPSQCPFEREIKLFGHSIVKIPPMCKLNPLYNEVVGLRFRAICYLADVCGEDVSLYC
ncbi:Mo-dependent nitrogenase C-terminal domain-containing protein [Pleurocapsa sp. FMAR1]|uniref:Mo-dependent nitrogenase C-terminal domain-containing protein n=1 Tax=Pleurocapsa sp. FMAR1 TaxID=3040204 RepID=UPI0029C7A805|nr:Mo-dependent nitrogenase C-terminal domain-containing protein [Pleurocapsa sp. FMAR1]